jgi:thiol-disulfide isomerase/thioredoxin
VALCCELSGVLSGCSGLDGTGSNGYAAGDSAITEIKVADRKDPVAVSGEDLDGKDIALDTLRGDVVVVNVWWSGCAPCRAEAPMLTSVDTAMRDRGVAFFGINIRDSSPEQGKAFVRTFGIPFRSLYDPQGTALLEFHQQVPPNAIPSTLVLDRDGRVAARVLGPLPSETTLRNLVEKVVAEDG